MDSADEKPRVHPTPVPFCESIIKPTVPEVSLISSDNSNSQSDRKNDSFSGTEFQTYNAWRWKYMSGIEKVDVGRLTVENSCPINDKYSSSETEKRKNEILYGQIEEPRKPLQPKTFPKIPNRDDLFSSNNSLNNFQALDEDLSRTKFKDTSAVQSSVKFEMNDYSDCYLGKGFENSKNLYNIITEQNKQIDVLQKQIDKILKLQAVKDKQIEQLLISQESKEKKIEKLIESALARDQEIEMLQTLKEKQEQWVRDLIKSQEEVEFKYMQEIKKLNCQSKKNTCSIGTNTDIQMVNCGTNTSAEYQVEYNQKTTKETEKKERSYIRDVFETTASCQERDRTLSLHSTDLPAINEQVPTPQSSIHLDMQDFHYSSEESESEVGTVKSAYPPPRINTDSLGYTFYNNVMSQVKGIIQNAAEKEQDTAVSANVLNDKNCEKQNFDSIQSYQAWGVLQRENIPPHALNQGPDHFQKRYPCEPLKICGKDTYSPSDVSLKINSLALKYLKQEQISQYDLQPPQIPAHRHHDVTIYNVTNLSFGSTRYLDRHTAASHFKSTPQCDPGFSQNGDSSRQRSRRKKVVHENLVGNGPTGIPMGNILQMSTLNQQSKLP
ncbi:hypothetical protein RUM44_001632 [Polyplax serrata]|uniref:Uncharacterized protein n=1 Tax=Polyplax serrata TaxID=468196 RepID=A0ABR1AKL4_POLSC